MVKRFLCFLLLLFICAVPAFAQSKTEKLMLDNGLTVLLKQDKSSPAVAVFIAYRVGSRNEQIGKTGISHLLEHLLFRGTEKYPEEKLNNLFYVLGADFNAFTSYDVTAYHEVLPAAYLENALAVESDRMKNSSLSQESVNMEQKIVLNELDMYDGDASEVLSNEVMNVHFRNHPYRWSVGGFNSDVAGIVREDIVEHYRTYYVPNNAILSVVGNFDRSKCMELINKYFASIPRGKNVPAVKAVEPEAKASKRVVIKRSGNTSYMNIVFHATNLKQKDIYPLSVAQAILTFGKSSRLYKALVDTGIATSVTSDLWESVDPGVFSVTVKLTDASKAQEAEKILLAQLAAFSKNPPTKQELAKAVNGVRSQFISTRESVGSQAFYLGYYEALGDYKYSETFLDNIKSVKAEDVVSAASRYFVPEKSTIGFLLADGKGGNDEEAPKGKMNSSKKLFARSLSAAAAASPKAGGKNSADNKLSFEKFKLENGLTLIVKENHSVPVVHLGGFIRNCGSAMDKPAKFGCASLTALMLERGAGSRTFADIASFRDFNALSLNFGSDKEKTSISGWMLAEKLPEVMKLSSDMLMSPTFPDSEFDKLKKQRISYLQSALDETSYRALRGFSETYYPKEDARNHAFQGTVESVANISVADVKDFYKSCYRPENTVIVIVGDIKTADVKKMAQEHFGKWKVSSPQLTPPKSKAAEYENPVRENIFIDNKPQNFIVMGHSGVNISSPDYAAFNVMNLILGGGALNSRLGRDIRVEKGLVYFVGSNFAAETEPSQWYVYGGVASDNVDRAIGDIKSLLTNVKETGITQKELDDAKANRKNILQVSLSEMSVQKQYLERIEFNHLPADYVSRLIESYEKLTVEDVNKVLRKYIHPDKMITVVAGSYKKK